MVRLPEVGVVTDLLPLPIVCLPEYQALLIAV